MDNRAFMRIKTHINASYPHFFVDNLLSNVDNVSISGNTVTIRGNVNSSINLSLQGITTTVTPYKSTPTSAPSKYVLSDGKLCDFSQEASALFIG